MLGSRDKRAILFAAIAIAAFGLLQFFILPAWDELQAARLDVAIQEQTLAKYRHTVAIAGEEVQAGQQLEGRLKQAETGILRATVDSLASAELEKLLKEKAAAQAIELRSSDFQKSSRNLDGYREIPVGIQFECQMDQLVNFLSGLQSSEQVLAVPRINIQPLGGPEKQVNVSMTVSGWMRAAAESTN